MSEDYLIHHGIKGQKHGERRYQNKDGSLTNLGRIHYGVGAARKHREDARAVRSAARIIKGVRNPVAAAKNLRTVGKVVKREVAPSSKDIDKKIESLKSKKAEALGTITDTHDYDTRTTKQKQLDASKPKTNPMEKKPKGKFEANENAESLKEGLKKGKDALRRHLAPNSADLDAQIAKLEAKQKEVREREGKKRQIQELKDDIKRQPEMTKRGENAPEKKSTFKRIKDISNMSDDEINARINRLKKQSELANAEIDVKLGPVLATAKNMLGQAASEEFKALAKTTFKKLGESFLEESGILPQDPYEKADKEAKYWQNVVNAQTNARKAQGVKQPETKEVAAKKESNYWKNLANAKDFQDYVEGRRPDRPDAKKPEGGNSSKGSSKGTDKKAEPSKSKSQEGSSKPAGLLKAGAKDRAKSLGISKGKIDSVERLKANGKTIAEIARMQGLTEAQVKSILYHDDTSMNGFAYIAHSSDGDYLVHYGAKGMHWGERRWQDYAGRLTEAGRIHYGIGKRAAKFGGQLAKAKGEHLAKQGNLLAKSAGNKLRKAASDVGRRLGTQKSVSDALRNRAMQLDYFTKKNDAVRRLSLAMESSIRSAVSSSNNRFHRRMGAGRTWLASAERSGEYLRLPLESARSMAFGGAPSKAMFKYGTEGHYGSHHGGFHVDDDNIYSILRDIMG